MIKKEITTYMIDGPDDIKHVSNRLKELMEAEDASEFFFNVDIIVRRLGK